jgi:predicted NAD/FAD-dependent oxidoreductase
MSPSTLHRADRARIGVIGAGVAGLAAARTLTAAGHELTLLDKGRGPGGRTSSRQAPPYGFDHGAQYFTAREPQFRGQVSSWVEAGVVARWSGRIVTLGAGAPRPAGEADERFVGVPRMSALARHLARDLDVRCATRVESLERDGSVWRVRGAQRALLGTFERLVVTAPPAQAAALIGAASPLGGQAAGIRMRPCWAVLLGMDTPYEVELDGAFCEDPSLSWVARDSSKPGRPPAEAWVLHATPEWTEAHLDRDPDEVVASLGQALERLTGVPLPEIAHADAHRWMYARPEAEIGVDCLVDIDRGLALAGDAYRGGRVEGAWLSGLAAARQLA